MTFNKYIQDETILKTLEALGYELMLPVQNQVIPVLKKKKDCIIQSKTGSGKTLSFVLPLIDSFEVPVFVFETISSRSISKTI